MASLRGRVVLHERATVIHCINKGTNALIQIRLRASDVVGGVSQTPRPLDQRMDLYASIQVYHSELESYKEI